MNKSRKLLEAHLAEYRRQTATLVENLSAVSAGQAKELKGIVKSHAETVQQASVHVRNQLWEIEGAGKRITKELDDGIFAWKQAKGDFLAEREKLNTERQELAGVVLDGVVRAGASGHQCRDWSLPRPLKYVIQPVGMGNFR
jgi:predicted  nucleic acid-binding Zn-ribbon protein